MKKTAYTLAEVLITLTIIGVITVLTIPHFVDNSKTKSNSVLLKTTYKQVGDALQQALIDQGVRSIFDLEFSGDTNQKKLSTFLYKYMDVVKDCGATPAGCFADSYTSYTGSKVDSPFSLNSKSMMEYVKLSNGVALAIRIDFTGADASYNAIMLDANAKTTPNAIGKDLFTEKINSNGSLGSTIYSPGSASTSAEKCKGTDGATAAETCLQILKAKDWDLENYLN